MERLFNLSVPKSRKDIDQEWTFLQSKFVVHKLWIKDYKVELENLEIKRFEMIAREIRKTCEEMKQAHELVPDINNWSEVD